MAKKYNGTISFASALKPTGAQPLDDRMVVQSMTDLLNASTFSADGASAAYNGMMVAVLDEQQVFMLVNAANLTSEDSWVPVGAGNGSVAVETYAEAVAIATEDNIGQVIYVKTKSSYDSDGEEGEAEAIEYEAAPYIVIGNGQLQKLAASTASGSIEGDVAELATKVSGLETRMDEAEGDITTNAEAIEDLVAEDAAIRSEFAKADEDLQAALEAQINTKVSSEDYNKKVSEIEGTIAENDTKAQGYASAAQSAAESHADGLNTAMDSRVGALEAVKDDYKTADETLEGKINAELAKKVNITEGYRLMSETEGTKLAGIAEGANVNVIETIKVDGQELTPDASKAVNIVLPKVPVKGVTNKEGQIITLDENGALDTTLTIEYVKATEDANAQLRLMGVEGKVVSSIDATDFIKDGMVDNVTLTGPKGEETGLRYLEITWNLASGKEVMRLDVSELFNPYTAGDGLNLADGKFSLKLATDEQYLAVGTDGLSLTQALWNEVNRLDTAVLTAAATDAQSKADAAQATAISTAATDAQSKADAAQAAAIAAAATDATNKANDAQNAAQTYADGLNTAMNTRVEALEAIDHEHENQAVLDGITADKVNAWDAAEQNAKDYADGKFVTLEGFNEFEAEYEEKLNGIAAGAQVNIIESVEVNGIAATIDENKKASVKIEADDIELGTAISGNEGAPVYEANTKISVVLQGINDSIRAAVAGGVNSVVAGDNVINVNNGDANNPKVSLIVEASSEATVAAGHVELIKGDNGLYGVMYYDGDDAE